MRNSIVRLATFVMMFSYAAMPSLGQTANEPEKPLAAWFGVFPDLPGYTKTLHKPLGFVKGKTYSQSARYEWTGGALKQLDVTLVRNKTLLAELVSKAVANEKDGSASLIKKGRYRGWYRTFESTPESERPGRLSQSLFFKLAKDRMLLLEARGNGPWENITSLSKCFNLNNIKRALGTRPRTDYTRKRSDFKKIKKGTSYAQVVEWLGPPDEDIGSGIHIFVYRLNDHERMLLGFPDFDKLIYVKRQRIK